MGIPLYVFVILFLSLNYTFNVSIEVCGTRLWNSKFKLKLNSRHFLIYHLSRVSCLTLIFRAPFYKTAPSKRKGPSNKKAPSHKNTFTKKTTTKTLSSYYKAFSSYRKAPSSQQQ